MTSIVKRRIVALLLSSAVAAPIASAAAATPERALAAAAHAAKPQFGGPLQDAPLSRTGPIAGPAPSSPAAFRDHGPVRGARVWSVVSTAPVPTAASHEHVLFLVDHRNLYRGPGSLAYMVKDTKPLPAPPPCPGPRAATARLAHIL